MEQIDNLLKLLTLFSDVIGLLLLVLFIFYVVFRINFKILHVLFSFVQKNVIALSLIVSLAATLGSLFYSEVMNYTPCVLCWYQRILMYPQALLFWLAFVLREKIIVKYTALLSIVGGAIALYHYLHQIGVAEYSPCSLVGYSSSCADAFFTSYGYITIPMMSFTAFTLLLIFAAIHLFYNKPK